MERRPWVRSASALLVGLWGLLAGPGLACKVPVADPQGEGGEGQLPPEAAAARDRVVVLVVPGVDADLLERWLGELPGFERLVPGRAVGRLRVDGPALSGHTAAQLATGARAGGAGPLGGAAVDPSTMALLPAALAERTWAAPPFWEVAAVQGASTRALWVPGALPATPIPGLTVLPAALPAARPAGPVILLSEGAAAAVDDPLAAIVRLEGAGPWAVEVPLGEAGSWPLALGQQDRESWRLSTDGVQADIHLGEVGAPVAFALPSALGGGGVLTYLTAAKAGDGFALGLLAPGMVAAPGAPVTSPEGFADEWVRAHGQIDTTGGAGALLDGVRTGLVSPEAFARALREQALARRAALLAELQRMDARLVVAWLPEAGVGAEAFLGLGDSAHPAWSSDRAARYGGASKTAVIELDATVRAVREGLKPGDRLLVVSDRGMASVRTHVDLNAALAQAGLLTIAAPDGPEATRSLGAGVVWGRTVAYATGGGLVYLNRAGRQREGAVPAARAARELARVSATLSGLKEGKRAAIAQILPGEQVFPDAAPEVRPDLVVRFAEGFGPAPAMVQGRVGSVALVPNRSMVTGGHDPGDGPSAAGFAASNFGPPDPDAHLADVGPTVLRLLGLEPGAQMTGRAWSSAGEAAPTP